MASPRLPRFHRLTDATSIVLTGRDQAIIRTVFDYRFLRSTHILSLISGSRQQILRRLQLLFHRGHLDRPLAQIDYYRRGSKAIVYALGKKGIQLLEREDGIPHQKSDWTARNRTITRYFMEHTLAVADVLVALELACRARNLELVRYRSPTADVFKWTVPLRHDGVMTSVAVVPDQVVGIKDQNGTRWFFLEADRATMPVERNNLKQTSVARKLLAYHETWRQKILRDSFPRFQVLTVTTTPERIANLLEATYRLTQRKGSGLFLFTDHQSFTGVEDVLKFRLLNGRGESVGLLD